jgi:hypothetical protein
LITQRGLVSLSSRFELMIDGIASVFNQWLSNKLSNNSSSLGISGASATELEQAKCQIIVLLLGGLGTENRKVSGSTPLRPKTAGRGSGSKATKIIPHNTHLYVTGRPPIAGMWLEASMSTAAVSQPADDLQNRGLL